MAFDIRWSKQLPLGQGDRQRRQEERVLVELRRTNSGGAMKRRGAPFSHRFLGPTTDQLMRVGCPRRAVSKRTLLTCVGVHARPQKRQSASRKRCFTPTATSQNAQLPSVGATACTKRGYLAAFGRFPRRATAPRQLGGLFAGMCAQPPASKGPRTRPRMALSSQ